MSGKENHVVLERITLKTIIIKLNHFRYVPVAYIRLFPESELAESVEEHPWVLPGSYADAHSGTHSGT